MTIENNMTIRLGTPEDLDALVQLYDAVCDHMAAAVNYTGWKKGAYPAPHYFQRPGAKMAQMAGKYAILAQLQFFPSNNRSPKAGTGHRAGDAPLRGQPGIGAGCKGQSALLTICALPSPNAMNRSIWRLKHWALWSMSVSLGLEDIGLDRFLLYEKLL